MALPLRLRALLLAASCLVLSPGLVRAQAAPQAADAIASPPWQYTVRPGDTLIALGQRYLRDPTQWPLVQRDNRIANPRSIPPGTVLLFPASLLREQPSSAHLLEAFGAVRWRARAKDDWQAATPGQALAAGAQVQVPEGGSAVIELANGTRLALQPGSMLSLDTLSLYADGLMADTRLRLQQGQLEIRDNPKRLPNQNLRILTPSAQAVVRGTQFRVSAVADATREETLAGTVDLQAQGAQVRVAAEMGSLARAGQAPLLPVRLLAAPDLSALPARFEQLPLNFPLPELAGAASWFAQVLAENDPAHVLLQKTASGKALNFADLPNGRYVLRLRAVDANGLQGLDATHTFTVFARPFFPLLTTPVAGATVRLARPTLRWSAVRDVARTQLQVARTADFSHPLFDVQTKDTQWTPTADLSAGEFFWRAASVDAQGRQGPWSKPQAFRYVPGPGSADLSRAAIRYDADHLMIDLPPAPAGQHYALTLSDNANLQPALAQAQSPGGALTLPRPSSGRRYLGARLVDDSDGTEGPPVVQAIEVPARYPGLWLLLIPLLPAL